MGRAPLNGFPLALACLVACSEPPRVEVTALVGSPEVGGDAPTETRPQLNPPNQWNEPAQLKNPADRRLQDFVPVPPTTPRALAQIIEAVRAQPWDIIPTAARNLAQADPAVWPQVRAFLLQPRARPKTDYKAVLATIGGDVPDRYGRFKLTRQRAQGHRVRLSDDWFEDLLSLPSKQISHVMRPVYRDCVLQASLLRATAAIAAAAPQRNGEVVSTLLAVAYMHHGTFRDEVGRALQRLGDPAVPHLLQAAADRHHSDEATRRRGDYAIHNLDRSDRLEPRRTLASVRVDLALFLDTVEAYGSARFAEAAQPLLELFDHEVPRVREASRAAFMSFVTGPPPKRETRTLRLLGGATTTRSITSSYRKVAAAAVREALETETPGQAEPRCRSHLPSGLRDRVCEGQPERLTLAYIATLDRRRRAQEQATLTRALIDDDRQQATAAIDQLLATGVRPPDPTQVVAFFVAEAQSAIASRDVATAAQLLRKSAMLSQEIDPSGAARLRSQAFRLEARAPSVTPDGRRMLLASAGVEPQPDPASDGGPDDTAPTHHRPTLVGMVAIIAALLAMLFLGGRLRPRLYGGAT